MVMGNGALAGLVAITAGCSTMYPWASVVVGLIAGFLYNCGSRVSVLLHVSLPFPRLILRKHHQDSALGHAAAYAQDSCLLESSVQWSVYNFGMPLRPSLRSVMLVNCVSSCYPSRPALHRHEQNGVRLRMRAIPSPCCWLCSTATISPRIQNNSNA